MIQKFSVKIKNRKIELTFAELYELKKEIDGYFEPLISIPEVTNDTSFEPLPDQKVKRPKLRVV